MSQYKIGDYVYIRNQDEEDSSYLARIADMFTIVNSAGVKLRNFFVTRTLDNSRATIIDEYQIISKAQKENVFAEMLQS